MLVNTKTHHHEVNIPTFLPCYLRHGFTGFAFKKSIWLSRPDCWIQWHTNTYSRVYLFASGKSHEQNEHTSDTHCKTKVSHCPFIHIWYRQKEYRIAAVQCTHECTTTTQSLASAAAQEQVTHLPDSCQCSSSTLYLSNYDMAQSDSPMRWARSFSVSGWAEKREGLNKLLFKW